MVAGYLVQSPKPMSPIYGHQHWQCLCSGRYPFTPPVDDRTGRPLRPAHVESFLQLALLSTQGIFYSLIGLWVRARLAHVFFLLSCCHHSAHTL
jgi:hypothetical protein